MTSIERAWLVTRTKELGFVTPFGPTLHRLSIKGVRVAARVPGFLRTSINISRATLLAANETAGWSMRTATTADSADGYLRSVKGRRGCFPQAARPNPLSASSRRFCHRWSRVSRVRHRDCECNEWWLMAGVMSHVAVSLFTASWLLSQSCLWCRTLWRGRITLE